MPVVSMCSPERYTGQTAVSYADYNQHRGRSRTATAKINRTLTPTNLSPKRGEQWF